MADMPIVWLYWDSPGGGDPGYIELCRQSIHKWAGGLEVVVLNQDNISSYIPDIHSRFADIPVIAHRADYARAAVLASLGGIWLDSDTVVLAPLELVWALTFVNGAAFYGWKDKEPSIGMIAAESGHPMMRAWRKAIERRMDESLSQRWMGFGYDLLWPIAKYAPYAQVPRTTCAPTHWTETGLFGADREVSEFVDHNTLMVQLYNRGLSKEMGGWTPSEILSSNTLLGRLFAESSRRIFSQSAVDMVVTSARVAAGVREGDGALQWWDGSRYVASLTSSYAELLRKKGM